MNTRRAVQPRRLRSMSLLLLASTMAFAPARAFAADASAAPAEAQKPSAIEIAVVKRPEPVDFGKDILPIFRQNCTACHNAKDAEAELVLETSEAILKGGESGPAVVPGKAMESLLLRVSAKLEKPVMPPKTNKVGANPLTPQELGLLKLWIDQGAKGAMASAAPTSAPTTAPVSWRPLPAGLNPIYAIAATDDGQLAACNRANQIFVYSLPRRSLLTRLTDPTLVASVGEGQAGIAHRDLVHSLAFSPDGKLLASGGYREVKLWQRPDPMVRITIASVAPNRVASLVTSPDGKTLAAGGDDGTIRLFNLPEGKPRAELKGHAGEVSSLRFSADGATLFSGSTDKSVRTRNLADGTATSRFDAPQPVAALLVAQSKETGERIVTAGGDNVIRLWARPAAPRTLAADVAGPFTALAASPDRKRIAVAGGADHAIRLVDVESGTPSPAIAGHAGPVRAVSFSSDGTQFLTASDDGTARLWAVEGNKELLKFIHPNGAITAAALRPDGKQAATADAAGHVTLWRLDTPAPRPLGAPDEVAATVGVMSRNHQLIATAGMVDGKPAVLVRNIVSGEITQKLLGFEESVTAISFSADSNRVAAGSADKTARVWSLADGKEIAKFAGHGQPLTGVAFHPDNERVLTAAADGTVKLWPVADGKEIRAFPTQRGAVDGLALLSKDQLITASADGTLNVFDVNTGNPVRSTLFDAAATAMAVSSDGARIALATADKKVRVLSVADGAEQAIGTVSALPSSLSFSADGKRLVATVEKRALVFDADTGLPIETVADTAGILLAAFGEKNDELTITREDKVVAVAPLRFTAALPGATKRITSLSYTKDGSLIVSASEDGIVRAYGASDGSAKYTATHGAAVRTLAFSPDGALLATGGDDGLVKMWNATTGAAAAPKPQLGPLAGPLASVAFSTDGRRVIAASTKAGDVWMFDRESAAPLESFADIGQPLLSLVPLETPKEGGDAVLTLSAAAERPLAIRRTAFRGQLAGHTGVVTSLARWGGDVERFVSGSADGTLRQWQLNSPTPERQFTHGAAIASVAVRGDGKVVASAGTTFAKLFDVASGKEIATLRGDRFAFELAQSIERQLGLAQAEVNIRNQKVIDATAQHAAQTQHIAKLTEAKAAADKALAEKQPIATAKAAEKAAADTALAEAVAAVEGATKAVAAAEKTVAETKPLADAAAAKGTELAAIVQQASATAAPAVEAAHKAKAALDAGKADTAAKAKAAADAQAASDAATAENAAADKAVADAKTAAEKDPANATLQDASVAAAKTAGDTAGKAKAAADALAAARKASDESAAATKPLVDAHAAAQKIADEQSRPVQLATLTLESVKKRTAEAAAKSTQAVQAKATADEALAAAKAKQTELEPKSKAVAAAKVQADNELAAASQAVAAIVKSAAEAQANLAKHDQDLVLRKASHAAAQAEAAQTQLELDNARKAAATERTISHVQFTPDGATVVLTSDDGAVRTFSAETGIACDVLPSKEGGPIASLAVSPDGTIFTGASDRTVRCWDANPAWTLKATIGTGDDRSALSDRVLCLAFSPDGSLLATGGGVPSRSGELKLWSVATGQLFRAFPDAHSDAIYGLDFSGDGSLLATGGADKFAKVWDVQTGALRRSFEGHTGHVLDVSMRHDGRVLVTGGADNAIKLWDLQTGEQRLVNNPQPTKLEVTSVSHIGFTDRFLVTSGDGATRLLREDLNVERSFDIPPPAPFLYAGAASIDGATVFSGGYDSILRIRDARDGKTIVDLAPPAAK